MPARRYHPPPLRLRVRLRNPADRPAQAVDRYNRPTEPEPVWGDLLWANRRDRHSQDTQEEGVLVQKQETIWTFRWRDGTAANAEVVHGGQVWQAIGPPVLRGGTGYGRRTEYMEIRTELRA